MAALCFRVNSAGITTESPGPSFVSYSDAVTNHDHVKLKVELTIDKIVGDDIDAITGAHCEDIPVDFSPGISIQSPARAWGGYVKYLAKPVEIPVARTD